jgi:hypothetical protein
MVAQKAKVLIALLAAVLLLVGAGVAYAANSPSDTRSTGDHATQVGGDEDSDRGLLREWLGDDADEPGDVDGPGDTED